MEIRVGLDIGIASVGWAVVNEDKQVIDAGSRLFEAADAGKNEIRRGHRGIRRLTRRKIHRGTRFDELWTSCGLPVPAGSTSTPLLLRNKAINEPVSVDELYNILKNMLKHRGISYLDDAIEEGASGDYKEGLNRNAKMLETMLPCEIQLMRFEKYGRFRGNNLVKDENTLIALNNVFTKSAYRKELLATFEKQATYHTFIDDTFIDNYMEIFDLQRAFYDGPGNEKSRTDYGRYTTKIDPETGKYITDDNLFEKLIGKCSAYPDELRAAKASYTAQEFNVLNDLNNLTVNGEKLTEKQKRDIIGLMLTESTMRIKKFIQKAIGEEVVTMTGARVDAKDKEIFHTFEVYRKMRKSLGFDDGEYSREELDFIGHTLTINTDEESIRGAISKSEFEYDDQVIDDLVKFRRKYSGQFSGWHSFSLKIMNELIPVMYREPKNQMEVLTEMGVFKSNREFFKNYKKIPAEVVLEEIYNPVVKRAVNQSIQVLNKIIEVYGYPKDIIIEMARDKNEVEQRDRIRKAQSTNEKELSGIINKVRTEYNIEIEDRHYHNHKALKTKLRLWNEQQGRCPYSGRPIRINEMLENPSMFEIDHIIPISISFDDSRGNKVLVYSTQNQLKGNQTPYMYISHQNDQWGIEQYSAYVLGLYKDKSISRHKMANLLFQENITKQEVVMGFISRNLNDTRYASRVVLNMVQDYMKAHESGTKVKVVRGSFTAQLRNKLHLQKDRDASYAHHAVDAMIMCYSQLGLDAYKSAQKDIIDYETGEILDEAAFNKISDQNQYELKLFYDGLRDIQQTILEAESKVKYSHKVDKKVNRQLSNETIYGTRVKKDGTNHKISKINDIYSDSGCKVFLNKVAKGKSSDFLIYQHDPQTFNILMKTVDTFGDKKNPFQAYRETYGESIRKYSRKGNGPFIKSLKYYDGEVGSCIDISHKYGHEKGSKKVILDSLKPFRMDVYYRKSDKSYHLAGIKYANFKFEKGQYVLDKASYNQVLIDENILEVGDSYSELNKKGFEFCFSLYKNDLILYEKNGIEKAERFLARTMPQKKNYIETKPLSAANFEKRSFVGLSKTKKIIKINTDVLGNRHYTEKENFTMSFRLDK